MIVISMELFFNSWLYPVYAALFGVCIGSFLNVFLYRFHTGKSLGGHSHCLSCNVLLTWYQLVPLVSYLALRGRCQVCRSYIPVRYFVVELLTAAGFVLVALTGGVWWLQVLSYLLIAVLVSIVVYDINHTIIPDEFTLALIALALAKVASELTTGGLIGEALWSLLAGVAAAGPFFFLWVISQGRWIGLGDAKLAVPLGIWVGLELVVSLVIFAFWIGAAISVAILALQWLLKRGQLSLRLFGRPLTMKSEVPFAPFLILSFIATAFWHLDLVTFIMYGL